MNSSSGLYNLWNHITWRQLVLDPDAFPASLVTSKSEFSVVFYKVWQKVSL